VKVRQAGRIVSVAVTVAVAVNTAGRREVLGMAIGASEPETFWIEFLRELSRRGCVHQKLSRPKNKTTARGGCARFKVKAPVIRVPVKPAVLNQHFRARARRHRLNSRRPLRFRR
jgi:hypothetical protein